MRGELPTGWVWSSLEETCTAAGGGTPSKAEPAFWDGGTIPWVSPKDMKARVITGSEDRVTEQALQRLTLIPPDSVLLVVRSGILSRTLPVAVTALPVTVNQDMRAFIPHTGIASDFLAWQLIGRERDVLAATSKDGTTVASIEAPALASFPLAIAPAAEQTRIVEKLEELLSDLDAGVAELKAAQVKLQHYRQSLLKAAVEGSLTAAWREANPAPEETGADLLARILRERRARWEAQQLAKFEAQGKTPPKGWQSKYVEPAEPDATALPALPAGWVWCSIDQLAHVGTGVTPLRSRPAYFERGTVPWVTSGALNNELVSEAVEMVTELALKECRLEVYPPGSLLVAMYGEGKTRGKCAELGLHATINQAIAAIVLLPGAQACKEFVKTFLLDSYEAMRAQASGGVQPNLNLQIVKSLALPLPPLVEQTEIAANLSAQLGSLAEMSGSLAMLQRQSTAQRQNLLRAAFAGQLVPQDPADEPSAELLARIRAERAARAAPGKARKARPRPEAP